MKSVTDAQLPPKNEDDFGFSFIDDKTLQERADTKLAETNKHLAAHKQQIQRDFNEYHDIVTAFLMKLAEKPQTKTLIWPNRGLVVSELSDKLNKLISPHWFR